jgi:hypothetical protein
MWGYFLKSSKILAEMEVLLSESLGFLLEIEVEVR